eukprot:CAMPEP_0176482110 /NCGR_PEP_ID=MMETSP0200_2-20121128/3198_1 /TAXON_ID=947934 /ORGANISM="Chaetoceros sp., Strain GSL56" /LENGTH=1118 /DNA_ID=CAMNT_0017878399 /DNA_START=2367 /DNA_END=5720 /DNA_ORIENTATION=+
MPLFSKTTTTLLFSSLAASLTTCTHAFVVPPPQYTTSRPRIQLSTATTNNNNYNANGRHPIKRAASISTTLYNDERQDDSSSSSSSSSSSLSSFPMTKLGEQVRMVQVAYIEEELLEQSELAKESLQQENRKAKKKKRVVLDVKTGGAANDEKFLTFDYMIDLPITTGTVIQDTITDVYVSSKSSTTMSSAMMSSSKSSSNSSSSKGLGLALRQIENGEISEKSLDLDTMRYISLEEMVMRQKKIKCFTEILPSLKEEEEDDNETTRDDSSMQILNEKKIQQVLSSGIVVSSVKVGGIAWDLGIRAGDLLVATSATMGDKMWPKSTLEGVRSAITSRKVMSKTMQVQFQRINEIMEDQVCTSELVQEFEMSLTRPMGIHIEDTQDGYVRISGFTDDAPDRVINKLKVGDRIIAVDSSLGNKMWPVSNVEGVVSAVTTRLPGQPVQIRFERLVEQGADLNKIQSLSSNERKNVDRMARYELTNGLVSSSSAAAAASSSASKLTTEVNAENQNVELLSRCRSVLKRYIDVHDKKVERSIEVLALVADRVLESLAESSSSLDANTLSLIMNAYILSDKPSKALRAFEAATGLKADGSPGVPETKAVGRMSDKDGIVPSLVGVNMCTATDVIRAHAHLSDGFGARRVLAAMEGTSLTIGGIQSHPWGVNLKADTKCYNVVLSAIANSNDIEAAQDLFEKMPAKKDLVSFNTMIGAYARAGMRQEAYAQFKMMKNSGVKPDKVTITALIKAVLTDDDFDSARQLLKDMKKAGIGADVVTYNTVIQALCAKSKWFEAKELVAEMETNGISPNSKTYGLLMNGLLKLNKPGPCLTLFESACADQRTAGLMENAHLYTTAITAAASLGDSERAFELLSRMNFSGVKPNLKTLTALMGACISDDKHSYALDVYKKINSPDGYAQTLAIRAHCGLGEFGVALGMIQNNELLSGNQIMRSYNYIIGSALNKRDFSSALRALDDLLKRGFIPSKETLQIMVKTLGLFETKQSVSNKSDESDKSAFIFLINVLDSCSKRKLQISGQFYAGLLLEGARIGGLERKIASIITSAKTDFSRENVHFEDISDNSEMIRSVSWSELLLEYNHLKDQLEIIKLPPIRVQITDREVRR